MVLRFIMREINTAERASRLNGLIRQRREDRSEKDWSAHV